MKKTFEKIRNNIAGYYLSLVQLVYGRDRLSDYCEECGIHRPVDLRSRLAGWMQLRRNF